MDEEKIFIMDQETIKLLTEAFLNKVNEMLDNMIVTTIDENSTDDQIISAKALNKFLNGEDE